MENRKVRVRFAPSPTGPLHIGGVRTALYNYLFAKKCNGDFILRIEDTDQTRFVKGAEEYIIESLKWCGIEFTEGVVAGGSYGPYRQSERKHIYKKYADQLINGGFAYYAFDSGEELEKARIDCEKQKATFIYNSKNRNNFRNSFTLSGEEIKQKLSAGEEYVIRFKMPENETVEFSDIVREKIAVDTSTLDDKVLFKSDGMPTYHLANVVDDYLMEISHVIRGEEWLPSTPLHVLLYRSFGWEKSMPQFAHMPLTLKPDGKGKLSKRDGDRLGFPVFPVNWTDLKTGELYSGFRERGFFPDAFINILVLLGWNSGTEQEIFSMKELVNAFSLEKIGKSGARFDFEKAKWFNHQYLIKKTDEELADLYMPVLKDKGINADKPYVVKVCGMVKERVDFVSELWEQSSFFFQPPQQFDEKEIKKTWKEDTPALLNDMINLLSQITPFESENIEQTIKQELEEKGINAGQVFKAVRLALVGEIKGPHLFNIMGMLGKEEVLKRIDILLKK